MRVFFSIHSVAYLRLYESTIREMASRGHEIHLAMATSSDEKGWSPAIDTLRAEYPTITDSLLSPTMATFWTALAMTIRPWADYLRYLHPDYDSSPKLKARAAERVPPRLVRLTNRFRGPGTYRWLRAVLRTCERALPPVPEFEQALRAWRPDVVLVTPLLALESTQCDLLRTATSWGVRTAFCVASLGPPVEQGPSARPPPEGVCLERHAERRSGAPTRRSPIAGRGHWGAVL